MSTRLHLANCLDQKGYASRIANGDLLLRDGDVADCRTAIVDDKDAYFINALLSYAGAIWSLRKDNYSWAFVQSYYCIFYLAKVMLAEQDYAVYYVHTTPFSIKTSFGELFLKEKGNSHVVILKLFGNVFGNVSDVCSEIDGTNNIEWFNQKREEINYRLSPMPDPEPPFPLFKYNYDMRKWIAVYEGENLYSFDKEHCYIAYTTYLIKRVIDNYRTNNKKNKYLTDDLLQHLRRNIADEKGPFVICSRLLDIKS